MPEKLALNLVKKTAVSTVYNERLKALTKNGEQTANSKNFEGMKHAQAEFGTGHLAISTKLIRWHHCIFMAYTVSKQTHKCMCSGSG